MSKCPWVLISIFLALFILTPAPPARSSEKSISDVPVTLHEAMELAMQNREEIQREEIQVAIHEARVKEAKSAFFPTLDFLGEANHTTQYDKFSGYIVTVPIGNQIFTARVDQAPIPYEIFSKLELNYNLYSGGRDRALIEEASAKQSASEYQKTVTLRKVVLDITTAYWELRKSQVAYNIAERWREYYLTSQSVAEEQWKAGRISEIDREVASLRLQEQEIAATQAKRVLANNLRKYRRALGLKDDEIDNDGKRIPTLTDDPDQEITLPEPTLQQHPELSKMEAEVKATKAYWRSVQAEYLPAIDFFATYAEIGRDQDTFPNAFDDVHRNNYVVGLRLKLNLFEGFKTRHKAHQAHLEEKLAQLRLEQKRKELADILHEKSLRLENAKDDLGLAQQRLRVSEAKEKMARVQRQTGKYSELEYRKETVTAQEDADKLLLAKIDIILARLNLLLASLD
jgi:outer membrane protein TolC